jgi:DNA-binding MarR family transcriptional regulator
VKLFQSATSADCAAAVLDVVPSVMRSIRCKMRAATGENLSVVQFRTLAYLDRNRGGSLSDVAEFIGLTLPSASKLVQSLILKGFLTRETVVSDRRKSALAPTSRGVKILETARKTTHRQLADELSKIPGEQRRTIVSALAALREVYSCDPCTSSSGK